MQSFTSTTTSSSTPMLDLQPQILELQDELQAAVHRVLASGRFIQGPEVLAFESEVAEYLGVNHAIGCNSGTDALVIALRALELQPGDEVITSAFTFVATGEAILRAGGKPVFVDIDPASFNLCPKKVAQAITNRTRAILPVHLYGLSAEMDALGELAVEHGIHLIEDAAQCFGARVNDRCLGTIGHAGAFSFFPSKNLGAFGDAGMVVTDDDGLADIARKLRQHGATKKYHNEISGYNSRLDEIQAAMLRVKLPYIDQWNDHRIQVAKWYNEILVDVPELETPVIPSAYRHVFHQYTIRVLTGSRESVRDHLQQHGIASMVYYPRPLHQLPVFAQSHTSLPATEFAAKQVLSLPMGPSLSHADVQRVCETLLDALPKDQAR